MRVIGEDNHDKILKGFKVNLDSSTDPWKLFYIYTICSSSNISYPSIFYTPAINHNRDIRSYTALSVYCYNAIISYFYLE
jgi:hypothetical protein